MKADGINLKDNFWYLFNSHYQQKLVLLIIDAEVGLTANDKEILRGLEERKNILIVANKVDKIKNAVYLKTSRNSEDGRRP